MQKIKADTRFRSPFGCMVCGPSMSGKSHFIMQLIRKDLFDPRPDRIVYAYGSWQDEFIKADGVEFVSGIDGLKEITFNPRINNLLILDDLMEELSADKKASTLFTKDMHHKNVTVIFVVQNLFKQGKSMRDIALNCQVIVLFKSPRDVQQIRILSRQTGIKELEKAYLEAIKEPYGYLVINMQSHTPDAIKLQTDIFAKHRKIFKK